MRLPTPLFFAAFAALASAAALACQAPVTDDGATPSSEDHLTSDARKGAEFVRCFTVSDGNANEFFRQYLVTCHVTSAGLPPGSYVNVDATGARGRVVSGTPSGMLDQDVVIGRVSKTDFPLSLRVYGAWMRSEHDTLSSFRVTVPAPETANASAPVVVKMPFDTWPITFLNHLQLAVVSSDRYDVQAAPFKTSQDENTSTTTFVTQLDTGAVRTSRVSIDVVAPASGSLRVQVQGPRSPYSASITSAGTYVIEETGLRLATAAEEASANGGSSSSGTDGGGAAPDAQGAQPAPTTTCGGPGQMHCTENGNWKCLDGTRGDLGTGICLPCGNDQETYCVISPNNVSGNHRCNDGTRIDSPTGLCVACGAQGQTHCFTDANNVGPNWMCDPGLNHYDAQGNCQP